MQRRANLNPDTAHTRIPLRIPMSPRAIDEPHRAATQLELLFDLTFVVAVAAVVAQLGHGVAEGHAPQVVGPFLLVFFAIWWAWMNFTYFASSYDTDDVPYRLLALLQMSAVVTGSSIMRGGVAAGVANRDLGGYAPRGWLALTPGRCAVRDGA